MMASAETLSEPSKKTMALQTHHEVQVNVVDAERLQRAGDALFDALVPWVVELGRQPDLLAGHARGLDARADLVLVAVCQGRVNVPVAGGKGGLNGGLARAVLGGLPRAEADGGHLVARGEGVGLAVGF